MLDRVRQAVFNIIGAAWGDPGSLPPVAVLDIFAGSGALGIEALSRGAAHCCFVEDDPAAVRTLKANLKTLGLEPRARIVQANALTVKVPAPATGSPDMQASPRPEGEAAGQAATPAAPAAYGIVFLDPPYALSRDGSPGGPIGQLLASLPQHADLAPSALVVLRHETDVRYDQHVYGRFKALDVRKYGGMAVTFMERAMVSG
jgi:16S rRNA (guanine966-N2)-methyltransferase